MKEQGKKKNKKSNWFLSTFDLRYWLYDFAKITGAIPALIMYRLKTKCIYKRKDRYYRGPAIIVCNHVSLMDPPILCNCFWFKRLSFLAASDLYKNKFLTFLFNGFRCIKVDRDNVSIKIIKDAKKIINNGHSVCIFPEGHITRDQELSSFKSGAAMIATQSNAPIKQVYIKKREHWYQRVRVYVGKTIYPSDFVKGPIATIDEINNITKFMEEQEHQLINETNKK